MKLADALVDTLALWGIEFVFGVSGANIEHLHDAIHRQQSRIKSIFAKSEVGAAFMADGHARRHNRLAVCCSTSGGGMMNLAVGLAESFSESVPILAIIGQPPVELEGRGAFQDSSGISRSVNAHALFAQMTKFVARIDNTQFFWQYLKEAITQALTHRPGPSVLLIPRNLYDQSVPPMPADFPLELDELRDDEGGTLADIDLLWDAIDQAACPTLMLGTGASRSLKRDSVIKFAQQTGIAVVATMADPGIYPHDLPNYLGIIGAAGHPSAHAFLNEKADLIIAVGTGLNIMVRSGITQACKHKPWAVVNIDPEQIKRIIKPLITVQADAGVVFEQLLERHRHAPLHDVRPMPYELRCYEPQLHVVQSHEDNRLRQSEAIFIIGEFLKGTGHLIFDAGNCAAAAIHYLTVPRGFTTSIALGFGGMGYAIAAAVGAELGLNNSHSVVFCGDGAFLMTGTEVHTAVEYSLPILFIVFNNNSHGMCATRQHVYFEGRLECSSYHPFDAEMFSKSFGSAGSLWTGKATTAAELTKLLTDYFDHEQLIPGVLELQLDIEEIPPFAPFLPRDAKTYATCSHTRFLRHDLEI